MKYRLKAPAKINICLKVNGKSIDGYHDLTTIMQNISLYDIIEVEIFKAKKGKNFDYDEQISLKCNLQYIPTDDKNLIVRVVRYIYDIHNIKDKININLKKMIPTGAGLGGGSSDAASILLFLNRYYKLKYSLKELSIIAMQFGSDIPFFLYKKECICKGRGEVVEPVPSFKRYYILIATPDVRVSTKEIYEKFNNVVIDSDRAKENDEKVKNLLFSLERRDLEILSYNIFNDLELVTTREISAVDDLKRKMMECGAYASMMSGSGPTVFGIFGNIIGAKRCKEVMKKLYSQSFIFVARPI